jgi:hypothetical protein
MVQSGRHDGVARSALPLLAALLAACSNGPGETGDERVTIYVVGRDGGSSPAAGGGAGVSPAKETRPDAGGAMVQDPAAVEGSPMIPPENQAGAAMPDIGSAEPMIRKLFEAIRSDDASLAADLFFPASAFDLVKNMETPGRYHKKLVDWYVEDIHLAHATAPDAEALVYDGFEPGKCRWMEPNSEGNKLPYWACRYNYFYGKSGDKRRRFDLRVIINWGKHWYVTHLGPVRK